MNIHGNENKLQCQLKIKEADFFLIPTDRSLQHMYFQCKRMNININ